MRAPPSRAASDSLTRSALDFVGKAARQLKSEPKDAVINLATAIELFLKARLVREHWALVVSRPERASQNAFASGAFQSVGLDDAIERLRNIAGEAITRDEEACFRSIRDHRNKLVHFFHETYLDGADEATASEIAAEQCRAWFFLQRLLTVKWAPAFDSYSSSIERTQKAIASNREFLRGKYLALRPEIEAEAKGGIEFEKCRACGFESSRVAVSVAPIMDSVCIVCTRRNDHMRVPCPDCAAAVRIEELGEAECPNCGYRTTLPWLVEQYAPYEDPKEGPETAYCGYCQNLEARSVVPLGSGLYCLSCLEEHASIGTCRWCGESMAGDLEDSYITGCAFCSGSSGRSDD